MTSYLTVPTELLGHADVVARHFDELGYRLKVEPDELEYPFTPTWTAKRGHTLLIVEIQSKVQVDRLKTWVSYAKACQKDTRVVVAVPDTLTLKTAIEQQLVSEGVGVLVCNDLDAYEKLVPKDQSISVQLRPSRTLPVKVRRLLAPSYEKFGRGDWREGFRSACQVLEVEARNHLKVSVSRGRVQLVNPKTGKPMAVTPEKIEKATAGGLATLYGQIVSPNHAESIVEQALKQINTDRVGLVHYEGKASTENRLRKNVGHHMFRIINALKALV